MTVSPRMRFRVPPLPVERFGLECQNVADLPLWALHCHGERVVGIELRMRHRKTDHDSRALIERSRGTNKQRMPARHLLSHMRTMLDIDDLATVGTPIGRLLRHQRISAPTGVKAMTSPPCRSGSNAASISVNEGSFSVVSTMMR